MTNKRNDSRPTGPTPEQLGAWAGKARTTQRRTDTPGNGQEATEALVKQWAEEDKARGYESIDALQQRADEREAEIRLQNLRHHPDISRRQKASEEELARRQFQRYLNEKGKYNDDQIKRDDFII